MANTRSEASKPSAPVVLKQVVDESPVDFSAWAREEAVRYTAAAGMRVSDPRVETAQLTRTQWDAALAEFLAELPDEWTLGDTYIDPPDLYPTDEPASKPDDDSAPKEH